MQAMIDQQEWVLDATDRCDAGCTAQAYVKVIGVSGELFFCSHHYNRAVGTETGQEKMFEFAYQVIDEREKLVENRLVGEN